MPAAHAIRPNVLSPASPTNGDLVVMESVNANSATAARLPDFGTPHPRADKYPHHKFGWAGDISKDGVQPWYYVASRDKQHLYNWEWSDASEWPTLRQTFLIPRDDFDVNAEYPPPPNDLVPLDGFSVTSVQQGRISDPRFDSLFVNVEVVRERLSSPRVGQEFDPDTGTLRTTRREKVPAGTLGSVDLDSGTYSEVQSINPFWSIRTIRQAQGLAGLAGTTDPIPLTSPVEYVAGQATRAPYYIVVNYSWPGVLNSFTPYSIFRPPLRAGGYDKAIVTINYFRDPYDGPCIARVDEVWTKTPPPATTSASQMLPKAISWKGRLLDLSVPATLHQAIELYETSGTEHPTYDYYDFRQWYPATYPADWPTSVVSDISTRPFFGGYLTRTITVFNPAFTALSASVFLSVLDTTTTTLQLSWVTGISGTVTVYVDGIVVAALATGTVNYTLSGLTHGTDYDVKVVISAIESNTITATTLVEAPVIGGLPLSFSALEGTLASPLDIDATGGAIVYSCTSLPTGFSIDSSTGVISGTGTGALSDFSTRYVTATNAAGSDTQSISFSYVAMPTVSSASPIDWPNGVPIADWGPSATNSPTLWGVSTVDFMGGTPDFLVTSGLSFNTVTGVFSGTPLAGAVGIWTIAFTATNAAGSRVATNVIITIT
jgi:hypothetical protein